MNRLLQSPLAVILLTLLAIVISVSLYINSRKIERSDTFVDILEEEVAQLRATAEQKEAESRIATSSSEKERRFRNELLLQKPGEYIIQVPTPELPPAPVEVKEAAPTAWEAWKELFF